MKRMLIDIGGLRADLDAAYLDILAVYADDSSWTRAFHKARAWLRGIALIPYDQERNTILLPSNTHRERVYVVGEHCECEAFTHGRACWHRAVWILIERALQRYANRRLAEAIDGIREWYDDPPDRS